MTPWGSGGVLEGPQDLEDLATAGWLSETLFATLELGVFEALGEGALPLPELARRCGADPEAFARLARALSALGLLSLWEGRAACTAVARRHLLPESPDYLGHSLAYRRRLARTWTSLADAVRRGGSPISPPEEEDPEAYRARVAAYVRAMDDVARHKGALLAGRIELARLGTGTILDLGGGAGALAAALVRRYPGWTAVVADLPEVVEAARELWARREGGVPEGLSFLGTDLLAAPLPRPPDDDGEGWTAILASNVVHAYGPAEAEALLRRAAEGLSERGVLVLHDFWTDGPGRGPVKSALFDLHMLVHTYQGRTYPWRWARELLEGMGLATLGPVPVGSHPGEEDTDLVVGARRAPALQAVRVGRLEQLDGQARALGLTETRPLAPEAVVTAPWVGEKCRFGCAGYGKGNQCPPRSPALADTRATLASYRSALLVRGEPPTAEFHRRMLALERAAFLSGAPRALALVAGPCRLCPECAPGACARPELARPSLEACGVDVYATAEKVGWPLTPVARPDGPAHYLGLLLVE
ncbi:MAG: hypothetical protein Kow0092_26310 [Deferrisomatales bacterium]